MLGRVGGNVLGQHDGLLGQRLNGNFNALPAVIAKHLAPAMSPNARFRGTLFDTERLGQLGIGEHLKHQHAGLTGQLTGATWPT